MSKAETLEDKVVRAALKGPLTVKNLHTQVAPKLTLRATYKAVAALMAAGVLVKAGKKVWINQEWVRKMRKDLSPSLPNLEPGERVVYTFTSIEHLDAFWKTVVLTIEAYEREGTFFYNPHNFWAYMPDRKESEDMYYAHFLTEKRQAYFTVGASTSADMEFKKAYQNEFLQIDARAVPTLSRRDHITVMGDFIITARLSSFLADHLDKTYVSNKPMDELLPTILSAIRKGGAIRLIFERSPVKAKGLRKLLSHNFVMSEHTQH